MDMLAATAPGQPMPQYQPVMIQPAAPAPKAPSTVQYIYATLHLAVVIFFVVMVYRFVRATERISDKIDQGIVVRKEDLSDKADTPA
jgi:hypothetical protein